MQNKISWLKSYSVLFVIVIFAILLGQLFVSGITINSISEKYLWRKELIRYFDNFKYIVDDRVFQFALIGENGWLFFTGDTSIQDYQKTSTMKAGNVKRLLHAIIQLKEKTNEYGGVFLLVIPPNKSTIYPQYMPPEIPIVGQASNLDRFIAYAEKNSNLQVLDLRPALMRASQTDQVYYKTDTHWNCIGAFSAYEEILFELAQLDPRPQAHSLESYELVSQDSVMDIPTLTGLNIHEDRMDAIPKFDVEISNAPFLNKEYPQPSLRIVVNSEKNLPDLMIFHDSFYKACLHKFIEPSFSRTISVAYREAKMDDYLSMIEAEKPDVVVVEILERFIDYFFWHISE